MTMAMAAEIAEMTASHNRHFPVVYPGGYHVPANVAQMAVADERIPRTPQRARAPFGIRRTASNRSGNHRFTKKMSANSRTMEMAQITLAEASMAKYGTFGSKFFLARPNTNQIRTTGIEASTVCRITALEGTRF